MVAVFAVQSLYNKASLWAETAGNFSVKLKDFTGFDKNLIRKVLEVWGAFSGQNWEEKKA